LNQLEELKTVLQKEIQDLKANLIKNHIHEGEITDRLLSRIARLRLNLHIVGGEFFDDNILFAIFITTEIMDSLYLCNNHISTA
jgi:hypothetical protein